MEEYLNLIQEGWLDDYNARVKKRGAEKKAKGGFFKRWETKLKKDEAERKKYGRVGRLTKQVTDTGKRGSSLIMSLIKRKPKTEGDHVMDDNIKEGYWIDKLISRRKAKKSAKASAKKKMDLTQATRKNVVAPLLARKAMLRKVMSNSAAFVDEGSRADAIAKMRAKMMKLKKAKGGKSPWGTAPKGWAKPTPVAGPSVISNSIEYTEEDYINESYLDALCYEALQYGFKEAIVLDETFAKWVHQGGDLNDETAIVEDAIKYAITRAEEALEEAFENDLIETLEESEYQEFFKGMLAKYGVKSPMSLDVEKRKAFFAQIKKGWASRKA